MSFRYSCKAAAIVQGGTTFLHGLGAAPDEWKINLRGPTPAAEGLYITAAPTATCIIVAASGADGTGDVFASLNHSIIQ